MREAIDYNALSWVRQELAATLKQARHHLEEYATSNGKESLQGCVAQLHEARGPLKMVDLKSADILTGEMEEVIADLLLDSIDEPEMSLELLMQGLLELPEYLYSLKSGRTDNPAALFPLVNSLRASRGVAPLEEGAVFSPDLSVRVPASVFDVRADHSQHDVVLTAKSARVRFQGGLLDWYRNGENGAGLQTIVSVLEQLQKNSASEPVARLWWVSAGVAEALRDGKLEVTPAIKRHFGQIDRQIKRLMDHGESVFVDVITDDLLKNLLFHLHTSDAQSPRLSEIRSTYKLDKLPANESSVDDGGLSGCSEELLQTVSGTVREDIVRIKEQLDAFLKGDGGNNEVLAAVADELHALGNMLGMIGMDRLGEVVSSNEQMLRGCAEGAHQVSADDYIDIANTLVTIEDALADISATIENQQSGSDSSDATFKQGHEAVISAVMGDMSSAKEMINEFLRSQGDFELLVDVPVILNRIHGGLQLAGQEQLAVATSMVKTFIARELVAGHRELSGEDLDTLADAICSIEYCVEELSENRDYGQRAMDIAGESLEKLGYAFPIGTESSAEDDTGAGTADICEVDEPDNAAPEEIAAETFNVQVAVSGGEADITSLPAINRDGDPEIIEIFIEEATEEIEKITVLIPQWCEDPANQDALTEIRRSFHTMKGSGRMVGAMATGEFSWAMENLVNNLLGGTVDVSAEVIELMRQSPMALSALLEQVKNPAAVLASAINDFARKAHACSKPGAEPAAPLALQTALDVPAGKSAASATAETAEAMPDVEQIAVARMADFAVLSADADEEIVEIFLEEAGEELEKISIAIPAWVAKPASADMTSELCRSFHTLKGSGRMAGAMRIGEFAWIVELLFNRLHEGQIQQSAGLFTFMVKVPDTLSRMLDEIRGVDSSGVDIQELMEQATILANGKHLSIAVEHAFDDESVEEFSAPEAVVEESVTDDEDDDMYLLEIFSNESREHLQTIDEWLAAYSAPGQVSDELYRALHTLSGISESAEMPAIGRLAGGLYGWFGVIHEERREVGKPAFEVLRDCTKEISRMVEALPDKSSDEAILDILCTRIEALPPIENVPVYVQPSVDVSAIVEASAAEDLPAGDGAEAMPFEADLIEAVGETVDADALQSGSGVDEAASDDAGSTIDDGEPDEAMLSAIGHASTEDSGEQEAAVDSADLVDATTAADVSAPDDVVDAVAGEIVSAAMHAEDAADVAGVTPQADVAATARTDPYADMDPELYEIFVEESSEVIEASEAALRGWSQAPDNSGFMEEFQRHLHTLKGSARMMDLEHIGNLSHAVESLMTEVSEDRVKCSPELFGLLADAHDRLADMVDKVRNRELTAAATDLEAGLQIVIEGGDVPDIGAEPAPEAGQSVEAQPVDVADEPEESSVATNDRVETVDDSHPREPSKDVQVQSESLHRATPPRLVIDHDSQTQARGEQVKVQSDMLDNMVNHAGEINIYRARMEKQISDYRFNLSELDQTISRLRDQLRQLEMETEAQVLHRYEQESDQRNADFDPLEMDRYSNLQQLSRSLMESISDLSSLQDLMENTTRDSETLLLQQSRVSTELQENLIRTRMIPFASLSPRLRRIARQAARQLDKKVEVSLVGEDGEMDRAVVERIIAPLEHMLRNSVAHGIELPRVRKAAGKPVTGNIDIEFERDGSEIVLRISDDGAGMQIDAIRKRAIERGMITEAADLPDEDIIQFVLQTGFSTASEVTQISGRGVGMDVVNSEVKQLGGSLHIESEQGKGATFTVRLPYTLAINQGMLVTAGDETFCVPLASVEGVVRFYPEELRACYGDGQQLFEYGSNEYRLRHLASLLETGNVTYPGEREQVPVLLVRAGEKRIGFHIEALQGIREVVIKPVGPQLSTVDGISGATILGDGRVVMILDMVAVSRREAVSQPASAAAHVGQTSGELVVMVVDDSITVRKVTTRLLERNGYKVVTAKDGVDAMGKLQESVPDIMLLDIEMPRMDGFELATHMRNDDNLRHVPIIMITSRTGDKHRERAEQIGVQRYLGKPYQEADLLDSIHQIIGVTGEMAEA